MEARSFPLSPPFSHCLAACGGLPFAGSQAISAPLLLAVPGVGWRCFLLRSRRQRSPFWAPRGCVACEAAVVFFFGNAFLRFHGSGRSFGHHAVALHGKQRLFTFGELSFHFRRQRSPFGRHAVVLHGRQRLFLTDLVRLPLLEAEQSVLSVSNDFIRTPGRQQWNFNSGCNLARGPRSQQS